MAKVLLVGGVTPRHDMNCRGGRSMQLEACYGPCFLEIARLPYPLALADCSLQDTSQLFPKTGEREKGSGIFLPFACRMLLFSSRAV